MLLYVDDKAFCMSQQLKFEYEMWIYHQNVWSCRFFVLKKKNLDKKVNYPRIAGNVVVLHEFVPYPTMISIKNMSMNMRATH